MFSDAMERHEAVVLITGGSRGLGRGIAMNAAEMGFSVGVNYAGNRNAAEETLGLCAKRAVSPRQKFSIHQADVSVAADRERLVHEALTTFGRIDALVNNAGMGPRSRADVTAMTESSFEEVLRTNLQGPFFLTQTVVRHWLQAQRPAALPGGFKIIFNSSISAVVASTNRGEYCISKAGLSMAGQLWAVRLAADGIQVFELRPGIMQTDMTAGVKEKYDALMAQGIVPQRRWGQPEDVGKAVGAILAGAYPYSTGEIIYCDGGMHIRQL
jgi:3-oxoacyl-[acyl-carrier protein] reductase